MPYMHPGPRNEANSRADHDPPSTGSTLRRSWAKLSGPRKLRAGVTCYSFRKIDHETIRQIAQVMIKSARVVSRPICLVLMARREIPARGGTDKPRAPLPREVPLRREQIGLRHVKGRHAADSRRIADTTLGFRTP